MTHPLYQTNCSLPKVFAVCSWGVGWASLSIFLLMMGWATRASAQNEPDPNDNPMPGLLIIAPDTLEKTQTMVSVEVDGIRLPDRPIPVAVLAPAQTQTGSSLRDLTQLLPSVSIRAYGPTGAAGISYRGLAPEQTLVTLGGMPLNSAFLGSADLSSLFLVEGLSLSHFSGGATERGGAVGAASPSHIELGLAQRDYTLDSTGKFRGALNLGAGRFGQLAAGRQLRYSHRRYGDYSVSVTASEAQNHFPFNNPALPGGPRVRQENAQFRQATALLQGRGSSGPWGWQFTGIATGARRGLPSSIYVPRSEEQANTRLYSFSGGGTYRVDWAETGLQAGYTEDRFIYSPLLDGSADVTYRSKTFQTQQYSRLALFDQGLLTIDQSLLYRLSWQAPPFSDAAPNVTRPLPYGLGTVSALLRQGPFLLKAGVLGHVTRELLLPQPDLLFGVISGPYSAHIQYRGLFRMPTLNDLYWPDLGNPDIGPERGRQLELRGNIEIREGWVISATLFDNHYQRALRWFPSLDGSGLFRPTLLRDQATRGIEGGMQIVDLTLPQVPRMSFEGIASLTLQQTGQGTRHGVWPTSQRREALFVPNQLGKIALTARHASRFRGTCLLHHQGRQWSVLPVDGAGGRRIPPVTLLDFELGYERRIRRLSLAPAVAVTNIIGRPYQLVEGYFNPGRGVRIFVRATL